MKSFKKNKNMYILGCIIVIVILIIICLFIEKNDYKDDTTTISNIIVEEESNIAENKTNQEKTIFIHIAGEVVLPGIIEVDEGSRVKDVVEKAGGFTETADLSKVNLAYQVEDGQKINIPSIEDKDKGLNESDTRSIIQNDDGGVVISNEIKNSEKININTATQSELESLTGIGPSMASKIVIYRQKNGKFKKIEDIKNVSGIGDSKYEAIKNEICVK